MKRESDSRDDEKEFEKETERLGREQNKSPAQPLSNDSEAREAGEGRDIVPDE